MGDYSKYNIVYPNPLNARTGIVFQASKDICGGKVCDGSTFSMRERRRAIFRVIRPIAIFYSPSRFTTFSHFFFHVLGWISRVGFPNARA